MTVVLKERKAYCKLFPLSLKITAIFRDSKIVCKQHGGKLNGLLQFHSIDIESFSADTTSLCDSVHGLPILSVMCIPDLMRIIERHGLSPHVFTDDMKDDSRCSLSGMDNLAARVSACTDEILNCMRSNRLQLNADKTELIWCATPRRLPLLPVTSLIKSRL